ncbi:MAG: EVE domain-containing protein [Deltaproteobacteria bacterium]|nr:EVE domain-containing protein [Deltaproteobacteria bacterium]
MGNHIFLISQENFQECIQRGIYAVDSHPNEKTNAEIIASFEAIKPGDFVFFYVRNIGVYGLWKTTSRPFFDKSPIWQGERREYPYRVCLEPSIRYFSKPIALSDILDLRDKGKIWTFDLGAIVKKNHNPITTEEGKELIRLLLRNNPVFRSVSPIAKPYPIKASSLPIKLNTNKKGLLEYEGYLSAWFIRSLVNGRHKDVIGEYYDILNFVPTSFNKVMDVFLTHVTKVDGVDILHKFTCVELKTGICTEANLNQIVKYENWLTRKLANGDSEMVQSILISFDFDNRVREYVQKRKLIEEKTVRLLQYRVNPQADDIVLSEVN